MRRAAWVFETAHFPPSATKAHNTILDLASPGATQVRNWGDVLFHFRAVRTKEVVRSQFFLPSTVLHQAMGRNKIMLVPMLMPMPRPPPSTPLLPFSNTKPARTSFRTPTARAIYSTNGTSCPIRTRSRAWETKRRQTQAQQRPPMHHPWLLMHTAVRLRPVSRHTTSGARQPCT